MKALHLRLSTTVLATTVLATTVLATATLAAAMNPASAAGSIGVEQQTQTFLNALAAGGGKPLEQLSSHDARAVLVGAQASVKLELPKADISKKTITVGGQPI